MKPLQCEWKALCIVCNHIHTVYDHNNNNVCQASTLSSEEITKIKQVFFLTLKHEMWSYQLLQQKKTVGVICFCYKTNFKYVKKNILSFSKLPVFVCYYYLIKTTQLQFD